MVKPYPEESGTELKKEGVNGYILEVSRIFGVIKPKKIFQRTVTTRLYYDNIQKNAIEYEKWLEDLHALGGYDIEKTEF